MIVLKQLRAPVVRSLGRGVTVTLRRLDTVRHELARARAAEAVRALSAGNEALAAYGLDAPDTTGAVADLADPAQRLALAALIGVVELAVEGVESWSGVTVSDPADDTRTVPAPVTRETVTALLLDAVFFERLSAALNLASAVLAAEGNGLGPSGGGSLTSAGGPATAEGAVTPEALAPAASADAAASAAPP